MNHPSRGPHKCSKRLGRGLGMAVASTTGMRRIAAIFTLVALLAAPAVGVAATVPVEAGSQQVETPRTGQPDPLPPA